MPPPLQRPVVTHCSFCLRGSRDSSLSFSVLPGLQQVRGKKQYTSPWHHLQAESTVVVQLRKNVRKWGKQGSYVTAPSGLVRNKWLPQRQARYIVGEELKELHARGARVERDTMYGVNIQEKRARAAEEEVDESAGQAWVEESEARARGTVPAADQTRKVEIELVEPDRAVQLLDALLPAKLRFERAVRNQPTRTDDEGFPDIPTSQDLIYGSVSIGDIVELLRQTISHNDEAARISLSDLDIRFVDLPEGESRTRVRRLGSFTIEIGQKGTDQTFSRTVNVVGERKDMADSDGGSRRVDEILANISNEALPAAPQSASSGGRGQELQS